MAIESQNVDTPFATGLQQKFDPRLVQMGAQTTLINGVIDKTGAISKRPGTTVMTTNVVSAGFNVIGSTSYRQRVFRNVTGGLAMLSNRRLWAYAPTKNVWSDIDRVDRLQAKRVGITTPQDVITSYDVASNGSYIVIAYCEAATLKMVLYDATVNAVVYGPVIVDTVNAADECRVLITNGQAIFAYQSSAAVANIRAKAFDLTAWTFAGPAGALITNCGFRGLFDAMPMNGGTNWVLAYITSSGANAGNVGVALVSSALTITTGPTVFAGTTGGGGFTQGRGIALHATTGEQIWIANAYDDGVNTYVRCRGLNPTTLATTTADGLCWSEVATQYYRLGIERSNATSCMVAGSLFTAPASFYCITFTTVGASGIVSQTRGYGIASKPFTIDARIMCNLVQTSLPSGVTQSTYITMDLQDSVNGLASWPGRPVATIAPRIVSPNQSSLYTTSNAALVSSTRAVVIGSSERTASGGTGIDLIDIQLPYTSNQIAQVGDSIYISSGTPQEYDGTKTQEMGFLHDPRSGAAVAVAGGGLAIGTYFYLAVFEWRDSAGQRSQSAPLFIGSATTAGANLQNQVTVGCLHLTQRQTFFRADTVGVAIYRTTVGAGVSGVYYRVFTGAIPTAALSSVQTAQITYVDNQVDAQILVNEQYNTAALIPGCPPSLTGTIAHNGRLVGIGDDGTTVWFSTRYDGGTTVPYFCDDLVQYLPDGGRATALASMDGQLIVFRSDGIYIIAGDGPDANGLNGSFSDARRIASDVGCTSDWRNVITTPKGVAFQSGARLYLLSRSLDVTYFSMPVEDTLEDNPVITSVTQHSLRNEIRWTVKPTENDITGYVVNWNYITDCWSVFDYYDSSIGGAHAAFESSVAFEGQWYAVNRSGVVFRENVNLSATGAYLDGSQWVTLTVDTAWLRPSGVQGYARVRKTLTTFVNNSPCDIFVSIYHDDADTTDETFSYTAEAIATWTTPKGQCRQIWRTQKGQSFRWRVSDGTPTGVASTTGAGPTFFGLSHEVAIKGGLNSIGVQ